jgi:PAS domain S-box-containing protein
MISANNQRAKPVILVVDDDRGLARLVEKALQREGFDTAGASSFQEAIDWLEEHAADLMLLDLKLGDIGGKELVDYLTVQSRTVPFVIITGQGDERVAVAMMKRGALDYLVKDVDFLQFVPEVVRRALGQLERDQKLAAAEEALRRSEAKLAKAQQIAHLGSFELGVPWSSNNYRSEITLEILGLDASQATIDQDEYIARVVHPEDRERYRQVLESALGASAAFDFEYRVVRPDGSIRHVQSIGEPVLDAEGRVCKLVGTLLDITEQRRLEEEILHISEMEQQRIGQDLHDGLCQQLAATELMSQLLVQRLGKRSKNAAESVAEIGKQVREAISQTRLLARNLCPVVLESEGLMGALQELAAYTEKMFRVHCEFACDKPVLVHKHDAATHLYRIAQEAVSNAIRHGKAKRITISLAALGDRTVLTVKDDGIGLPSDLSKARGMGLRIMRYRATMVGGSLSVQRDPAGGAKVVCSIQKQTSSKDSATHHHHGKGNQKATTQGAHR